MTEPTLMVDSLAVEIRGQTLLSDVRLTVRAGECLGIVGETGSGKTMTSRVITGTLDRVGGRVTAGTARLGDVDLTKLREREWRAIRGHRVALVPQSSQSGLDPLMTVRDHMVETVRALSPAESDPDGRARQLLEDVRLAPDDRLLAAFSHELSGGMRQRVMIALALAGNAELLIGDEPTTALDVTVEREILELLADMRRRHRMAMVLITHDLGVIEHTADVATVLYAGMTVETGPTAEVLKRPRHPYTAALLGARPTNASRTQPLANIPGAPPTPGAWPPGCRFAPRCAFATDACSESVPQLREVESGRWAACIRAEELEL